jgi:pimeloyl-ACP methyl ester carboxylesterase
MEQPAEANPPLSRTATAVRDVGAAVDFIKRRRGIRKLVLLGWSWGTTIMASFTTQNNENVDKLILYGAVWIRQGVAPIDTGGLAGAYRTVTVASAKARWLAGAPEDRRAGLVPAGWLEQWAEATWASDPYAAKTNPPLLRAPNGSLIEAREHWAAGKPLYDPADIRVPTLLVHAEWDSDTPSYMSQAYWQLLVNAPYKRYVEIGGGTHSIIMERHRKQLWREVQLFLDDDYQPE